jgi:hypothetical protein
MCFSDNPVFFYPAETEHSTAFRKRMKVQNRLGTISEITPIIAFLAGPGKGW